MLKFFALFFLFSTQLIAQEHISYEQALDEANDYLKVVQNYKLSCPGLDLVTTCGNKLCEPHLNESVKNCPSDCVQNVTVRSYNNITLCTGYHEVQIPRTAEEVADLVKLAISKKMHVRAIGTSHSATEVMCSQGMLILTEKLKKIIGISQFKGKLVVEAEAGVSVFELSQWLHERGYALDGLPHMGFRDVSLGGSIATGSHGSSPKHHGVLSNIVEAIEFVDGQGKLHQLGQNKSEELDIKALRASLGILGVTTKFKLRIQKQFNLAVTTSFHDEEKILNNGLINEVSQCDYGQLNWFPGSKKFMKTCGIKTQRAATDGANNEILSPKIPAFIVKPFKKVLHLGACFNGLMCLVENVRWFHYQMQPPMVVTDKNGKKKNYAHLVGPSHRMVSSHLTSDQEGFFQMDWEIAVPASQAQAALMAIKKHVEKYKTCLPLVGVFIRFAPIEGQTLLAHTTAIGKEWKEGETAVFFEMPVYVPVGYSQERFDAYEKQFVEFTKMLIEKFHGRPHWGKNRQWAFDLAKSMGHYDQGLESFQKVLHKYDPYGTFSNDFAKSLGLKWKKKN